MIYIVALGGGLKCLRKIHLNIQAPPPEFSDLPTALSYSIDELRAAWEVYRL